ncbi:unnamed protein product [Caenorhabditis auriculariae]|uniref:Uncharacterized protein n=1 Tax=Caenorhabditis auriculariae TaxID=2777116 RepID=A0A8S1HYE7_9PELO|nr:unnamed protein product [Caenorhabditis auriculariae]
MMYMTAFMDSQEKDTETHVYAVINSPEPSPKHRNHSGDSARTSHSDPEGQLTRRYRKNLRPRRHARSDGEFSSSGSSSSSVTTVINAARPFRHHSRSSSHSRLDRQHPCCVECREKELILANKIDEHEYGNIPRKPQFTDAYVFLMKSVLCEVRQLNGRRLTKTQKKLETLLRLDPHEPFSVIDEALFERQLNAFAKNMEVRLRAIRDVSAEAFRDVTSKFCGILSAAPVEKKGLRSAWKSLVDFVRH